MPAPHPPEFRRRAVELAQLREKPIAEIAKDLGISESCLRNWMSQADVDEGRKEGLSRAAEPLVVARPRDLQNPAGHRDVEAVGGELLDQPEPYFGRMFSRAK